MTTASEIRTQPIRIHRQRTKGWRMPPNTVYVGRPTKWGNPFQVGMHAKIGGKVGGPGVIGQFDWLYVQAYKPTPGFTPLETREQCVEFFERLAIWRGVSWCRELRGKNLACWCAVDKPCHADILLELANR